MKPISLIMTVGFLGFALAQAVIWMLELHPFTWQGFLVWIICAFLGMAFSTSGRHKID